MPRPKSFPWDITVGPDRALWFTEFGGGDGTGGNKIGRVTTSGAFRECPIRTASSSPYGIASGPDGGLWFGEFEGNLIGRLSARGCLVRGKTLGVERRSGKVLLSLPGGATGAGAAVRAAKGRPFRSERKARQIPVGSFVDVRKGSVILSSGRDAIGSKVQAGVFTGGVFQVLQSRKRRLKGLTTLRLNGGSFSRACGARGSQARQSNHEPLARSARRRVIRRLGSNGRGRFRISGRYSAATARGTAFNVVDRCDGTLTKVSRGKVVVRDFRRKRTVIVRAGKSYLARAR